MRKHYKTIVLSDIHLGSEYSKSREVTNFLKSVNCDRLILNGDIIDGWQMQKSSKHWKSEHTQFIKVIMKMMEKCDTDIVYIRGNHDDFLEKLIPFSLANIKIVRDFVLESGSKRYFVTHGDIFDTITTNMKWLAVLGDWGYTALLNINKYYNLYRQRRNLPYRSLSQKVKHSVKSAVNYISDFRTELVTLAKAQHYDGVICGHIHQAANEMCEGIHYLNSGDWVESLSALTEDEQGNWNIEYYSEEKYGNSSQQFVSVEILKDELPNEIAAMTDINLKYNLGV